jgi:meiotically up-regulated gene 157 (Mug157) protein
MPSFLPTRRDLMKGASAWTLMHSIPTRALRADGDAPNLPHARPHVADRHFSSPAIEAAIPRLQKKIADPALSVLVENCFPNTLDTTVHPGIFEGKPDTYVVTGDIDAMWLRDSSAQVWPYLALVKEDDKLRALIEGVIRRQTRMILIDPYANAFMRNPSDAPLSWAVHDVTDHHAGVGERKWEIDSLCYAIRLAHGYWKASGDSSPFDSQWRASAEAILRTFKEQQRKHGHGPYSFQRDSAVPYDTVALSGFGNPAKPNGMIFSMFRPSDDACIYPLFVPANLFAVRALGLLAELAAHAARDTNLAERASSLASEVLRAVQRNGQVNHSHLGTIWAYEVDGYGNASMMDDANAPSLLSMPYLGICPKADPTYIQTRGFSLSEHNPYFFRGSAAEGTGGPHIGLDAVWPMSIMFRALTTENLQEIRQCLLWLRNTTAGTGFMHESFNKNDPSDFTRPWFAWANTLFGELILKLANDRPDLLASPLN